MVDYGFDRYLASKRAAPASDDPVQDLRTDWDTCVAFAFAHPPVYRLMYSPGFDAVPSAAQEALRLLRARCWCAARPTAGGGSTPTWRRRRSCRPTSASR
ncbi:hypothetical protein [Dactylosporangium salmoneum]|uniref:hypothetical protein n=1 Tax=Dactylosporangium salmoneum TaxID=53361 RepID=UPI0031E08639